jgi:CopG family nickel-responsive transcriptional regulator
MRRSQSGRRGRAAAEEELVRFGISIPANLLKKFDELLAGKNNQNRSEAIRDLIRDKLVQDAWTEGKGEQVATLTFICDGQSADAQRKVIEGKKTMGAHLLSEMHLRIGSHQELQVLALRGPGGAIRGEAEAILGLKGVLHGKLVMSSSVKSGTIND